MSDQYTCAMCGNTYTKTRSNEEAMEEAKVDFPDEEDMEVICDSCYQLVCPDKNIDKYVDYLNEKNNDKA